MRLGAAVLLALLASLPGPQEVTVDCDAGDSLAKALEDDGTQLAVFLDDASILRSFSGVEIWGDVFAAGSCHLSLGAIALHGSRQTS